MSVELTIRGAEKAAHGRARAGYLARLFKWIKHSEKEWRARHAREVARILSLAGNTGERGFWRAD